MHYNGVDWIDKPKVSDGLWICWVYNPTYPLFQTAFFHANSEMKEKVTRNYSGMKEKLIQAHVASHMQKPFKPRAWLRHTPYT